MGCTSAREGELSESCRTRLSTAIGRLCPDQLVGNCFVAAFAQNAGGVAQSKGPPVLCASTATNVEHGYGSLLAGDLPAVDGRAILILTCVPDSVG